MKQFIYKTIIAVIAVVLVYEFTIGKQISQIKDKADAIVSKEGRKETINKLREEIEAKI